LIRYLSYSPYIVATLIETDKVLRLENGGPGGIRTPDNGDLVLFSSVI
jgi:hypothetical protein